MLFLWDFEATYFVARILKLDIFCGDIAQVDTFFAGFSSKYDFTKTLQKCDNRHYFPHILLDL